MFCSHQLFLSVQDMDLHLVGKWTEEMLFISA